MILDFLLKAEELAGKITRTIAAVCLMIVFALFLLNIITRFPLFSWNPTWIDETIQFFLVWMIFVSAAELVRTGEHFMVDILTDRLHGTAAGRWCRLISTLILLVTYAVILYFGIKLCIRTNVKATFTLPSFIKMSWFYSCIPLSMLLMVIYSIRDVYCAVVDITSGGAMTARLDAKKAEAHKHDADARAIARAAEALKQSENAATSAQNASPGSGDAAAPQQGNAASDQKDDSEKPEK